MGCRLDRCDRSRRRSSIIIASVLARSPNSALIRLPLFRIHLHESLMFLLRITCAKFFRQKLLSEDHIWLVDDVIEFTVFTFGQLVGFIAAELVLIVLVVSVLLVRVDVVLLSTVGCWIEQLLQNVLYLFVELII